jgi:hypothetical protein
MPNINGDSIAVYIPKEYFKEVSEIINAGLKEAKIKQDARNTLKAWWTAECSFINDQLDDETGVKF